MIISITSPERGMGKTVTGINIVAAISRLFQKSTLIIDTDNYYGEVEYYLSDSDITKGLDDFCTLHRSKLLTLSNFVSCTKRVHKHIDIMSSNNCYEINKSETSMLYDYIRHFYRIALINISSLSDEPDYNLFKNSDVMVVVLNQMRSVVKKINDYAKLLRSLKGEIIFVVNRYMKEEINYGIRKIRKDLKLAGFENVVFPLCFDAKLINNCNERSLLNFVLNNSLDKCTYLEQIKKICLKILQKELDLNRGTNK